MKFPGWPRNKPFRLSYRTRSITFTRLGTRFILVTLTLGIAAVNSGSNLLYLIVAMMLSMMLISGILSEQALREMEVTRSLPDEIYARTPFTVRYSLKNTKKRVTSFALTICDYYPDDKRGPSGFILKVPAGETGGCPAEVTVPARGRWTIAGVERSTGFPFGFFRKEVRTPMACTALVYPKVMPVDSGLLERLRGGLGGRSVQQKGHGTEIRNLRDYALMDEARLIHWKSSARLSTLVAKEFEAEVKDDICIHIRYDGGFNFPPDFMERFEDAVSAAASLARQFITEDERPVSLVAGGRSVPSGSGPDQYTALMEALALLEPSDIDPADFDTAYSDTVVVIDAATGEVLTPYEAPA